MESNYRRSDEKQDFDKSSRSPLNIRIPEWKIPCSLVLTGDHDDRVVPHSSIGTLQHTMGGVDTQDKPMLVRIDTKAGHGAGHQPRKSKRNHRYVQLPCPGHQPPVQIVVLPVTANFEINKH